MSENRTHTGLQRIRQAAGLTLVDVYEAVGINPATLSRYEQGKMNPGSRVLVKLLNLYGERDLAERIADLVTVDTSGKAS